MSRFICGVVIATMILLCGCAPKADESSFEAMDTVMSLIIGGGSDELLSEIQAEAERMDGELSAVDESGEIYALNASGSAELSADAANAVRRALELSGELGGVFDPTVYPAVREWGFTTGEYSIPDDSRLAELADRIDYTAVRADGNTVTMPEGVMLDLGAIAKGMLADEALAILRGSTADYAVLNLGGTIALYGRKPDGSDFRIGIADPEQAGSYFGFLSLSGGVISTSGGYERYFELGGKRYIHILDPSTARPVDNGTISVTVIADDGARADALSTALFVMGADRAAEFYRESGGFEFAILTDSGELYLSEGLKGSFTMSEGYDYELNFVE